MTTLTPTQSTNLKKLQRKYQYGKLTQEEYHLALLQFYPDKNSWRIRL